MVTRMFRAVPARSVALLILLVGLGISEPLPVRANAPEAGPGFDLADQARVKTGKRRFVANCAGYCHGSDGSAGRAPAFRNRPDFDPDAAFVTIRDGRRGTDVMPRWGDAFSTEEIWELVAYLRFLAEQKD